jgi:hypothetical protein
VKKWLKAVVLIYLVILFFGSFIAEGVLWTGAVEDTLPFIPKLKSQNMFETKKENGNGVKG